MPDPLTPTERLALVVARGQLNRGENPPINTTAVLVLTIERLTGLAGQKEPVGQADTPHVHSSDRDADTCESCFPS